MIKNAAEMVDYFLKRLQEIRNNLIKDIRGRGLMIAVEFHDEAEGARRYCEALREAGLLCRQTHVDTIIFAPPLTITKDRVDWALERIEPVLRMQ